IHKSVEVIASPDPSWRRLYRAGGISVFLYIVLGMITPSVLLLILDYNPNMNGVETLQFIASNRTWWIVIQYTLANTIMRRNILASAVESLVAQNNTFGLSEALFAISILIILLVILKGVFHKNTAYLGIVTFVSAITGEALK
ncbi:hypothetical protein NLB65_02355, partial [Candidatus Aminicenantes bacterium AC-335-B20]|nr:hypothetical protein [Candidatus Aminicenantes bacterium AC-335-B20]